MGPLTESDPTSDKLCQEVVNLKLTEQKIRQELEDLRRPYLLRNSQLLTALITTVGAIIGVFILVSNNYFSAREQLNKLTEEKTQRVAAAAHETEQRAEQAQSTADRQVMAAGQRVEKADKLAADAVDKQRVAESMARREEARAKILNGQVAAIAAQRLSLEQQVTQISRSAAFSELTAHIFETSTESARLLTVRIKDAVNPATQNQAKAAELVGLYRQLQDNLNYVAIAQSLLPFLKSKPGSDPMDQPWTFDYSLLDAEQEGPAGDTLRAIQLLLYLELITPERAAALANGVTGRRSSRYLYIRGQLFVPVRESPFFEDGRPRSRAAFTKTFRSTLAALLRRSNADRYRAEVLEDDKIWVRLEEDGNVANFRGYFPGLDELRVAVIGSDYAYIEYWSAVMSKIGSALFMARSNIASNDIDSYRQSLQNVITAIAPLRRGEHHFETQVPWLLIGVDGATNKRMSLLADFQADGIPHQQLKR